MLCDSFICQDVLARCAAVRVPVALFYALDGCFGVQMGIVRGLGLQLRMSVAVIASMWLIGVPSLYAAAFAYGGGLRALWGAMPVLYVVVNVAMAGTYARVDWARISAAIRARKEEEEEEDGAGTGVAAGAKDGDDDLEADDDDGTPTSVAEIAFI